MSDIGKKVLKGVGITFGVIIGLIIIIIVLALTVGQRNIDNTIELTEEEKAINDAEFERNYAIREAANIVARERDERNERQRYKFNFFAEVPGNPAYLIVCLNSNDLFHDSNGWAFKTGSWSSIHFSTTSEQTRKLEEAIKKDNIIILRYQRHGRYTDITELMNSPLATSSQSDIQKVQDVLESYSFSADTILDYYFWFGLADLEISDSTQMAIIREERRSRQEGGWKILDTYYNYGATEAIAYIEQRASIIQGVPLPDGMHQQNKIKLQTAKAFLREQYPNRENIPHMNLTADDIKE